MPEFNAHDIVKSIQQKQVRLEQEIADLRLRQRAINKATAYPYWNDLEKQVNSRLEIIKRNKSRIVAASKQAQIRLF